MQKYKSNIISATGAAIRGVPVTVLTESGTPASIYLDRDGAVPAPNPLTTDASGTFYFYAINGRYSLRTTVDGATITDSDVVLLFDPQETVDDGPIADAVRQAEAAAQRAVDVIENSGIETVVADAQNALNDAHAAVDVANSAVATATTAANTATNASQSAATSKTAAEAAAANAQQAAADVAVVLPDLHAEIDGKLNSSDMPMESGEYLPLLIGTDVAGSHTYSLRGGNYIVQGKLCFVAFYLVVSEIDPSMAGFARISLPINPAGRSGVSIDSVYETNFQNGGVLAANAESGSSIFLRERTGAGDVVLSGVGWAKPGLTIAGSAVYNI